MRRMLVFHVISSLTRAGLDKEISSFIGTESILKKLPNHLKFELGEQSTRDPRNLNIGTECDCIVRITPEDQRATNIIEKGTKHHTPGYEIPLPWKTNEPNLQNNRAYAIHRLNGLCQRFRREPDYQEDYHQAIQQYLDMGYASQVKDEDVGGHNEFYFPYR